VRAISFAVGVRKLMNHFAVKNKRDHFNDRRAIEETAH
jgi:hypothetical protein